MASSNIQWFPGHMAKARREATEKLHLVDVVLELVDARIPESSRNPMINEIVGQKPRIIVLNKSDMANPNENQRWLQYYQNLGIVAEAIDSKHSQGLRSLQKKIQLTMAPYFARQAEKGVSERAIRLMILGIPNVGKSTLINRFVGRNQAQTGNKPGVTKAQRWLKINQEFELLDTPGILWPKFEEPQVGIKLGITGAIKDTLLHMDDLALFLLDFYQVNFPEILAKVYHLPEESVHDLSPVELLMAITAKLNYKEDFEQASQQIIQDYRRNKLGHVTLDLVKDLHE